MKWILILIIGLFVVLSVGGLVYLEKKEVINLLPKKQSSITAFLGQEFFEDCSGGNLGAQWTVGDWAEGGGGDTGWCWITETGTIKNMTSNTRDLSSEDIAYANLTFDTDHVGFNGNDHFYVWIKNATTTVQLLHSIDDSILSFSFNLSEHIILDNSVQIIGGCLTIGKNDDCRWDDINITSYGAGAPPSDCWSDSGDLIYVPSGCTMYIPDGKYIG